MIQEVIYAFLVSLVGIVVSYPLMMILTNQTALKLYKKRANLLVKLMNIPKAKSLMYKMASIFYSINTSSVLNPPVMTLEQNLTYTYLTARLPLIIIFNPKFFDGFTEVRNYVRAARVAYMIFIVSFPVFVVSLLFIFASRI
jgi:hypothetical protein